ncbi:hypothetical protein K2X89_06300 [Myxococcota bacterium]|nr:hypothetical protein [Myxococcota bacterium]
MALRALGRSSFLACLAISACTIVQARPLPDGIRHQDICVEQHPKDKRELSKQVVDALRNEGLSAVAAAEGKCDPRIPFRLAYTDNWSWDMRIFLSRMTVEVFDAKTGESLAFGESNQDSFGAMGDSHRDVIDRAVRALVRGESR